MRLGKSALLSSIAVSVSVPTSAFAQIADEGVEAEGITVTARRQNDGLLTFRLLYPSSMPAR